MHILIDNIIVLLKKIYVSVWENIGFVIAVIGSKWFDALLILKYLLDL